MRRLTSPVCAIALLSFSQQVFAQPTVSHTSPGAVTPGQTIELTLHGAKLDDPLQVWTSFPAKVELVPGAADAKDQKSRVCKVTLDAAAPVGIGGLVVGSPAGVSDIALVMIDDLPSVADNGANHAIDKAQVLTVPTAIDGIADGTNFDFYKFAGKKDQHISLEVVATRIGTSLDSVVRLLGPDGSELMLADDDESIGADSRLSLTLPADGDYVVELHDNQYRGGGRYRMRIGDFPLVSVPYPLGGRLGSTAQFNFAGLASDGAAPVVLRIPDEVASGRVSIAAKFPAGNASGLATIVASPLPEAREAEPNDSSKVATPVTIPAAVNGHFHSDGDRDYFTFAAMKDQSLSFQAMSRSLGSPSLLYMRLFDSADKQLAETKVDDAAEWTLNHKFPADGMYCLMVEDLLRRGGPHHAYRVEIEPTPGFSLAIKNDKDTRLQFNAPANNGALALVIQCNRTGYDGAVNLALEDDSVGLRLLNPTIPEKAKEHRLLVSVPEGATAGKLASIRLVGTATVNDRPQSAVVETVATLRARRPQLTFPPEWMNGLVSVVVGSNLDAFYAVKPGTPTAAFDKTSGQAALALTLERTNKDFKDPITVMVENLPAGFTAAVNPDKDTYNVTVTGPKDAADGTHSIKIVSYGEFKGQGMLAVNEVPLEIKTAAEPAAAEAKTE
ncbi:MAG: PPC domain-containing protein [Planctomycetaceae bacterium]|nr:PPC domain-containing protein [Planctomycetales bacterium]MCB9875847.1 PPC domain-containing protein [Planctomycetaceae bacterium]